MFIYVEHQDVCRECRGAGCEIRHRGEPVISTFGRAKACGRCKGSGFVEALPQSISPAIRACSSANAGAAPVNVIAETEAFMFPKIGPDPRKRRPSDSRTAKM